MFIKNGDIEKIITVVDPGDTPETDCKCLVKNKTNWGLDYNTDEEETNEKLEN
jgi:hypothetical protein